LITENDVLMALAAVPGPDGKTPLPQSGAIAGIVLRDNKAFLSISVSSESSARLEPMRKQAEDVLARLPNVTAAVVTLTAERPASPSSQPAKALREPGPKAQAARAGNPIPEISRIIAVASGKGGVGKSTTACNLALALAGLGLKVGALDADVYGPSLPRLFGVSGRPELSDKRTMRPLEAFGIKLMSIGFLVEEETPMIWRGPMVMTALQQMLREVAWGKLDVLIVDMPPGTGDAQLTMAQAVPLAGAVIVSTPQDLALIDVRRAVAMFNRVDVPLLGLVENMSYFLCPHCGGRSDIFAHGGARHEAQRLGIPFLGEVPLALAIRERSDSGRPIAALEPNGAYAAVYADMARALWQSLENGAAPSRPAPRIVVE
jgi:ATP-binding protein involved in chromosome partitioning